MPGPLTRAIAAILADAFPDVLLTQRQFGDRIGMSKSVVSRTLLGERVLDIEQFTRICRALGLNPLVVYTEALRIADPK